MEEGAPTMKQKWPTNYPGANWFDQAEDEAVLDVLHHGSPFRYYGPGEPKYVQALEAAACRFYGVACAQAVNSGTGALITTLRALGIGPGCEVIMPAFMWVATVSAVVQMDAIPVLCEVDDSFNMDPADLASKITPRTRLIIAVHMAGTPCDMEAIMAVAHERNVPVIEDCAQANGGCFKGRKLGTFGKAGIFSFQLNKNATAGEGGLIITDDERLYALIDAAHDIGMHWINGEPTQTVGVSLWGSGRRMSELCGAVASVQLGKLAGIVEHMRGSKQRIKAMLEGTPGLAFRRLNDADGDTGPFLILLVEDEAKAKAAAEGMRRDGLGGAVRVADYGLHIYSNIPALVQKAPLSPAGNPWTLAENAQSVYDYGRGACPVSDALFARSILVPIPSRLTEAQERRMARIIRSHVAP